jgi:phosphoribosylformylglycinamidine synthase
MPIVGVQGKRTVKLAPVPHRSHRGVTLNLFAGNDMKARVFITLKSGVLDPQGKAIHHALEGLGFSGVNDVRAGKLIELDLADATSDSEIEDMCRKLLANTVIENFRIERMQDA